MNNLLSRHTGPRRFSSQAILLVLISFALMSCVNAQAKNGSAAEAKELFDTVAALDNTFFEAYNTCNVAKMESYFTEDVEFFHDKGGLATTRKSVMEIIKNNLCGESGNRVRRELVKGSLEVYPIKDYGAVAVGAHRFYLTQKGQKEQLDGIAKFANIWQKKDGQWRMSRVISYDHKPAQ
jgi:ketosteroid isomerase-like protein